MTKKIHFEPYAVEKYYRVTHEASHNINKIAVSFEYDGKNQQAKELKEVMTNVCDINNDLEKPDWSLNQLKTNVSVLKQAINTLSKQEEEDIRIQPETIKLQGLYDCWKRLFGIDFDNEK